MRTSVQILGFSTTCAIWSSTWIIIKIGLQGAPPFKAAGIRFLLAFVIVAAILLYRRVPLPRARQFYGLTLFLGIFQMGVPYGLVYWGTQHISSGLTAILFSTIPLFTAISARVLLGDPLALNKILGIGLGTAGVYVIYAGSTSAGGPMSGFGIAACLGSAFLASLSSVVLKKYGKAYDPFATLSLPLIIGATVLAVGAALFEQHRPVSWDAKTMTTIVYLALIGSVTAFSLYFLLLKHMDVTVLSYQTFIIPALAVLIGWLFLRETVTLNIVMGGGMILVGIALAILPQKQKKGR